MEALWPAVTVFIPPGAVACWPPHRRLTICRLARLDADVLLAIFKAPLRARSSRSSQSASAPSGCSTPFTRQSVWMRPSLSRETKSRMP